MKQKLQTLLKHKLQLLLLLAALLGVSQGVWGTTYYYRGEKNSWGATAMTTSSDGYYSYYSTSGTHQFKISTSTGTWDYNYTYVSAGFNSTDVTNIGDYSKDNCYCWQSGSHYILVYYPNTDINSTNKPIICASTTLPDDTPCTPPTAGTATVQNSGGSWVSSIDIYASSTVNLKVASYTSGSSIQWQSSSDNSNWSNCSGKTSASVSISGVNSTTYYRAQISKDGCSSTTDPVTVTRKYRIKVKKTSILKDAAYVFSWENCSTDDWPGDQMQGDGSWWYHEFVSCNPNKLIFNDGNGKQTVDIESRTYDCYELDDTKTGDKWNCSNVQCLDDFSSFSISENSKSVCVGSTFTIGIGSGTIYVSSEPAADSWTFSSSNSSWVSVGSSTGVVTGVTAGKTATITATARKSGYNDASVTCSVTVDATSATGNLKVGDASPVSGTSDVCKGAANSTVTLSTTSNVGTTYKWEQYANSTWSQVGTSATYGAPISSVGSTQYRLSVKNGACDYSTPTTVTVRVNPVPVTPNITGASTVCANSTNNAYGVANGTEGATYAWSITSGGNTGWTITEGAAESAATITAGTGNGTISVTPTLTTNSKACAGTAATKDVSVDAASNGGTIADVTACSGADTRLDVTGITGTVTKWRKKGASDPDWSDVENSASSYITDNPTENTSYKAVVTNGVCTPAETATPGVITVNYGSIARSDNKSTTFNAKYLDESGTAENFTYTISCGATNFRASVTAGSDDYSVGDLSVAGSTLTVPVTFRPSTHGTRNGTVTITYDKTNSTTGTATLSLTGTGKTLYLVGSAFVSGDAAWSTFNPMSYDRTAGKYHYRSESPNFGSSDGNNGYKILLEDHWNTDLDKNPESMYNDANWTFSKTGMDDDCVIGTYSNNSRSNSIIGTLSSGYVAPVDVYVTANTTTITNAKTLEVKAKLNCAEPSAKTVSASSPACNGGTVTITTASAESGFTYQLYVNGVADPEQIIESTSTSGLEFEVTASVATDADVTYSVWGRKTDNVLCDWVEVGSVDVSVKYPDIAITGIGAKSENATYPWEYITLTATTNCSTVTWDDAVFVGGSAPAYSESKNAKTYMLKSAITARPDDDYYLIGVSGTYGGCNAEAEYKIYINQAPAEPSCN